MANRIVGRINGVNVNKLAGVILGVAIGLSGCGSSGTSNDQGTSFLATGYSSDGEGVSGLAFSIYDTSSSAGVTLTMEMQNRLSAQFLRVDQISCSYEVPGSTVSLYQDSYNSSSVITAGGTGMREFQLISRDVIAYFANRVNELPAFPFRMNVVCSATAISQAGDVFQSNPLGVQVIVRDDVVAVAGGATIEESDFVEGDDTTITEDVSGDTDTTGDTSDGTSPL